MSWLTDIAGKAEDLLNRVDQTAATALQHKTQTSSYNAENQYIKPNTTDVTYGPSYSSGSAFSTSQTKSSKYNRPPENKTLFSPGISSPRKKVENDDEKLLRFLNSNEALESEEHKTEKYMKSMAKPKELVQLDNYASSSIKDGKKI